MNGRNGI